MKLIDFGIAKAALQLHAPPPPGNLKGKFDYMSPEQVEGKPVDNRSDLFALGTLLWELLTGERLFRGNSELATLEKVRKAVIPPPSTLNPSVKSALEEIVLKALAKDRDVRYQRAEELHEDLERFAQTHRMTFSSKQLSRWMKNTFIADNLNQTKPNPLMRKIRARPDGSVPSPEIALPRRRKPANTLQGFDASELQGLAPPQAEFRPTVQQQPERVSELRSQLLGGKKSPGPPGSPRPLGPPGVAARGPAPAVPAPRSKPLIPSPKPMVPAPASLPAFDGDEPETRVSDEVAKLAAAEADANPQTLISSDTADLAATFANQGGPPPAAPRGAPPMIPPSPASVDLLAPEPIGGSSPPGLDELDDNAETLIHMKGQTPEPQPLPGPPPALAPPPAMVPPPASVPPPDHKAEVLVMPGARSARGDGPDPALSALPTVAPAALKPKAPARRPRPPTKPELPALLSKPPVPQAPSAAPPLAAPIAPPLAQASPPGGAIPAELRPILPAPPMGASDTDAFPDLDAGLDDYEFDGPTVVDPNAMETVKKMEADRRVSAISEMVQEETGSSADQALPGPPDDGEENTAALEFAPHDMSDDVLDPVTTDPDALFTSQAAEIQPVPAKRRRGWLLPVILIGAFVLLGGIASAVYLLFVRGEIDVAQGGEVPGTKPKPTPKPTPKPAPKPTPKTTPKKLAKATPLKPEPKVEPKPEPKPEPKVEPKPKPSSPSPGPWSSPSSGPWSSPSPGPWSSPSPGPWSSPSPGRSPSPSPGPWSSPSPGRSPSPRSCGPGLARRAP